MKSVGYHLKKQNAWFWVCLLFSTLLEVSCFEEAIELLKRYSLRLLRSEQPVYYYVLIFHEHTTLEITRDKASCPVPAFLGSVLKGCYPPLNGRNDILSCRFRENNRPHGWDVKLNKATDCLSLHPVNTAPHPADSNLHLLQICPVDAVNQKKNCYRERTSGCAISARFWRGWIPERTSRPSEH